MRLLWIALLFAAAGGAPAFPEPAPWVELRFAKPEHSLRRCRQRVALLETTSDGAKRPLDYLPLTLRFGPPLPAAFTAPTDSTRRRAPSVTLETDAKGSFVLEGNVYTANVTVAFDFGGCGRLEATYLPALPFGEGRRFVIPPAGIAYASEQLLLSEAHLAALPRLARTRPDLDLRADLTRCREERLRRLGEAVARMRDRDKTLLGMKTPTVAAAAELFEAQERSFEQVAAAADDLLALAVAQPTTAAGTKAFLASLHARLAVTRSCRLLDSRLAVLGCRRLAHGLHAATFGLLEGAAKKRVRLLRKRLRGLTVSHRQAWLAHIPRRQRLYQTKFGLRKRAQSDYALRGDVPDGPAFVTVLDENRVRRFVERRIEHLEARLGAKGL